MFDDVEDKVHLALWSLGGLALLLISGVLGGLWLGEWQQTRHAQPVVAQADALPANPLPGKALNR